MKWCMNCVNIIALLPFSISVCYNNGRTLSLNILVVSANRMKVQCIVSAVHAYVYFKLQTGM